MKKLYQWILKTIFFRRKKSEKIVEVDTPKIDYTFAVFFNSGDANYRVKSVIQFKDCIDFDDVMAKAYQFRIDNPDYTMGAGMPGLHRDV